MLGMFENEIMEPLNNPDFDELSERMGVKNRLRKRNPFVLSSKLWLNVETKVDLIAKAHLVFSKDLYNGLTPEERLAAAAHEFAHIQEKHYVEYYNRTVIRILMYAPLLIALLPLGDLLHAFMMNEPIFNTYSQSVAIICFFLFVFAVSTIGFSLHRRLSWENLEIRADQIASHYVDPKSIESVLLKIDRMRSQCRVPLDKRISLFLERDHPEVERRIENLRNCSSGSEY